MSHSILANIDFVSQSTSWTPLSHRGWQLSALSFCLGEAQDEALLPFTPSSEYLRHIEQLNLPVKNHGLSSLIKKNSVIDAWQITQACELSAQNLSCNLKYPFHSLHTQLSSKAFVHKFYKPQFISHIISNYEEIYELLNNQEGPFVLKQEFGLSGFGHYFLQAPLAHSFSLDVPFHLKNSRLEKWVSRVFDFSTQWLFSDDIQMLGVCELINTEKGAYKGSRFPRKKNPYEDFIEEHLEFVKPALNLFHQQGFRGHLGIDAFVYIENNNHYLCPLIEINPRKTMGYAALNLSRHYKKPCEITVANYDSEKSLLPIKILTGRQVLNFKKNLNLSFL